MHKIITLYMGIGLKVEGVIATTHLGRDLAALGQDVCHPPTVKGWQGGQLWINRSTLLGRSNLALALLGGAGPYGDKLDPLAVARKHGQSAGASAGRFLVDLFVQADLETDVRAVVLKGAAPPADGDRSRWFRRFAHTVVTLPEFQLA